MWRHCNDQAVFCRQVNFRLDKFNAAVLGAIAARRRNAKTPAARLMSALQQKA